MRKSYVLPDSTFTGVSYLGRTKSAEVVGYLDFDGVLHHEAVYRHPKRGIYLSPEAQAAGRVLFEWAGHLEAALAPYPDVKLVLSTTWVRMLGFSRAKSYLPPALAERVIGATWHKRAHGEFDAYRQEFLAMPRGEQVWADVTRRRPAHWFAIDDDTEDWPDELRGHLVDCTSDKGLGDPQTLRALQAMLAKVEEQRLAKG